VAVVLRSALIVAVVHDAGSGVIRISRRVRVIINDSRLLFTGRACIVGRIDGCIRVEGELFL